MGWEHVIPQFVIRMKQLAEKSEGVIEFPIQGKGDETRSFVYIDDFIDGLRLVMEKGEHLGIYHIGTTEEVQVKDLAQLVAEYFGRQIKIIPGEAAEGGTRRRCPDIARLNALGYKPNVPLRQGLPVAAKWYDENAIQQQRR